MTQLKLKTWDQFLAEKESQNEGWMGDMARSVGNAMGIAYPVEVAKFLNENPHLKAQFEAQLQRLKASNPRGDQNWMANQAMQDVQGMPQTQPKANPAATRGTLGQGWGGGGDYVDRG